MMIAANTVLSHEIMVKLAEGGVKQFNILFTNDIDRGSFVADTLRADTTTGREEALVEIYKVMRPGEPPTKETADNLFNNLFFSSERYDLSPVGRMKFNRRLGRPYEVGVLIRSRVKLKVFYRMTISSMYCVHWLKSVTVKVKSMISIT